MLLPAIAGAASADYDFELKWRRRRCIGAEGNAGAARLPPAEDCAYCHLGSKPRNRSDKAGPHRRRAGMHRSYAPTANASGIVAPR